MHDAHARVAAPPRHHLGRPADRLVGPPPPRSGSPTSARTMLWQNASARTSPTTSPASVAAPPEVEQRPHGRRALALLAEGGEVLEPDQRRRGLVHRVEVEGRGPTSGRDRAPAGRRAPGRRRSGRRSGARRRRSGRRTPPAPPPRGVRAGRAAGCRPRGGPGPRAAGRVERPADATRMSGSTSTWATWPRAWTPASVRPATVTRTSGIRSAVASAPSRVPCTVRSDGWAAQPEKSVPS